MSVLDRLPTDNTRGYLLQPYLSFHICDDKAGQYQDHVHQFHKVILVLSGQVTYLIEGKSYALEPHDILLVPAGSLHKVDIRQGQYERRILWIRHDIYATEDPRQSLLSCFVETKRSRNFLLRGHPAEIPELEKRFKEMDTEKKSPHRFSNVASDAWMNLFLVTLNRMMDRVASVASHIPDPIVDTVLDYIRKHLGEDLGIEILANACHMSRFALMHRFKQVTGFTLHHFVQRKRLLAALDEIRSGKTAQIAALDCGFREYSSFSRAWKAFYGCSPREFMKMQRH